MSKPHVMRDQLAMRRFATMRNRSNAMQAARRRTAPCDCAACQLKRSLGEVLQRVAEDARDNVGFAAVDVSKAH